ncbi:hypothetical protein ACIQY5_18605 [Peribacillus frigoritolerans]
MIKAKYVPTKREEKAHALRLKKHENFIAVIEEILGGQWWTN